MTLRCTLFLSVITFLLLLATPLTAQGFEPGHQRDDTLRIIFIHNSTGIFWLNENIGKLRLSLEDPTQNDYVFEVHDARGVDVIGYDTKVKHWLPKFETMLDEILSFDYSPDHYYSDPNMKNNIVMFKSCYDSSDIVEEGDPPGDPIHWKKTIWNYKAAYNGLAEIFRNHPDTLFVPITAPPRNKLESFYTKTCGLNAHDFNDWLTGEFVEKYRWQTGLNNVAVFNFFGDVLARPANDPDYPGALKDEYVQSGSDSHPNEAGNLAATAAFLPFINNAVREWRHFQVEKSTFHCHSADSVWFKLDAGPDFAGDPYVVVGTASGTSPGTWLLGVHVPINNDPFAKKTWLYANTPSLWNFKGLLDSQGQGYARVVTSAPIDPGLIDTVFHFGFFLGPNVQFVSNAAPILIVP